ncbi:MAG: sn-glycerol-3-phosphate ABC transporter ATP-binding protein UgpC [Martelella sp.]
MTGVTLKDVKKSYGNVEVLHKIDLDIQPGEFVVFVGPSGCGKSTLLRMIAGLEEISGGTIAIEDQVVNDIPPSKRGIAMVFQTYALYPHMSVYDNMAFGMRIAKESKEEIDRRVRAAADMLQITPYLDRLPKALSGGQRQRVAIGRAICRDPKVFLFDEPLSNLDAALRVATRIEIAKLNEKMPDTTMIYVTHDQVEAMTLADRIVVLKDGVVQQVGTPMELYHEPANLFVAGFIGSPSMNFMDVDIVETDGEGITVRSEALDPVAIPKTRFDFAGRTTARLGLRPQYLDVVESGTAGGLHGKVTLVERLGTETVINVELTRGGRIVAALAEDRPLATGSEITLVFDPEKAHLFPVESETRKASA